MQALIIPFSDADADIKRIINRLLRLKKDFQVKEFDMLSMDNDLSEKFKDPFFVELGETIDHIRAIQRGEIEDDCQDAFEFLAELESELESELDSELKTEKNLEHAH